jgi:hypothetical protein
MDLHSDESQTETRLVATERCTVDRLRDDMTQRVYQEVTSTVQPFLQLVIITSWRLVATERCIVDRLRDDMTQRVYQEVTLTVQLFLQLVIITSSWRCD